MEATDPTSALPRLAAWRRPLRHAAVALAVLPLAWVAAHALADREPVRARIQERAAAVLASRLPGAALGEHVSVDWLFHATLGPLTLPAVAPGAPPVVTVERVKVRAGWLALLAGRIEPASVRLYGVKVTPGPGGKELRALVERLQRPRPARSPAVAASSAADPVLHVRDLTVAFPVGARTVDLGPFDLRLERRRSGDEETSSAELGLPGGGHAEASLRRARSTASSAPAPWSLSGHLSATAADLPAALAARAVTATEGGLSLQVEAEGTAAAAVVTLRGALAGLVLRGERLGPDPVGPLDASGEATLELSAAEHRLRLRRGLLRPAGPLVIEASGAIQADGEAPFELSLSVPGVDYGALLAALPRALAPGPEAPRPAGAVGGSLTLAGPLRRPEAWTVHAEVDLAGLREAARHAPPSPLRAPFSAHPDGDDGPAILLGPGNPDYVPVAELPDHVVRAITTSEDGGFFAHRGFDFDELRNALVAGVRAGKLGRGGSTISQQLAKNLYLSRDRTLARKAREALITVALEGTVPKARLLEIYLNLIEWGPGLHGIGPAARHYLGKDARALSPRQACFLATLIPSPLRSHAALAAGVPVQRWAERVDDLLVKLGVAGVIDEETLARELAAPLALAAWVPRPAPGAEPPGGPPPADADEPEDDGVAGGGALAPGDEAGVGPAPPPARPMPDRPAPSGG